MSIRGQSEYDGVSQHTLVGADGLYISVFTDPGLQAQAFVLWNANRTGPLVSLGRLDHVAWVRLPSNSSIFKQFEDPSSGPDSAHYELALGVRRRNLSLHGCVADFRFGVQGSATSITAGASVVSPKSRKLYQILYHSTLFLEVW